jgi:hypothetical protein
MNARLKTFYDQVGLDFENFQRVTVTKGDMEKFAELFVAECMEQINKVEEKGDAHLGGGYFYDGTRLCRDAIKQHFGVEP